MKSLNFQQKGSVNGLLVVGALVLLVALPIAISLTQKSQENRSSATSESSAVGICGKSTGEYFSAKPTDGLCDGGVLVWTDEKATDGDWNWTCKGDPNVVDSDNVCTAIKQ